MARVAVAVSGGVDSLFALVRLCETRHTTGHEVMALHGHFLPVREGDTNPVPVLRAACDSLGVPLHCVDMTAHFDAAVIAPFVQSYTMGATPNPCALCNARIKFGALWDAALSYGADTFATGHYAAPVTHPLYGRVLARAADSAKDQSYFLALVPRERLMRALFPLADMRKANIRTALFAHGLDTMNVPLHRESQDLCFVSGHYIPFLEATAQRLGIELGGAGPMFLDTGTANERCLGTHQGLWRYTEGQRKGLGVAHSVPLYVAGKDVVRNALLLNVTDTRMTQCLAHSVNLHVPLALWPSQVWAKTRYRQTGVASHWRFAEDTQTLCLDFITPQSCTAPGQVAAIYDTEGILLGGGVVGEVI